MNKKIIKFWAHIQKSFLTKKRKTIVHKNPVGCKKNMYPSQYWSSQEIKLKAPSFLRYNKTRKHFSLAPSILEGENWSDGFSRSPKKNSGYVLVVSLVLSLLMLMVGMGLLRFLMSNMEISTDSFFTEKAYFAAESGVEDALFELKKDPVQNIQIKNFEFKSGDNSQTYSLDTGNLVKKFEFQVQPESTTKFRMKYDENGNAGTLLQDMRTTENFQITPNQNNFHWKIICSKTKDAEKKTIALQNDWNAGTTMQELSSLRGTYDDETGTSFENVSVLNFFGNTSLPKGSKLSFENPEDKKSCFFSITNLEKSADKVLSIKIDNPYGAMAPEKAIVTSRGTSGKREKIISFEYLQNNLPLFFDFGLLQKE